MTVFPLARISIKLDMKDSVPMLRKVIPDLKVSPLEHHEDSNNTVKYFDKLKNHEGIKEIFNVHAKGKIPDVRRKMLGIIGKI